MKLKALFTTAFILSIQFLSARQADLDPKKWAVDLNKKYRSSYDTLTSLILKLEKVDSLQAFQFLDKLSQKGRTKGDHFQALFNCLKARIIYDKMLL